MPGICKIVPGGLTALGMGLLLVTFTACTPWYQPYGIDSKEDLMKLSAVPDLRLALTSSDADIRVKASQALGEIGPDARDAVPDLVMALEDERYEVRQAAADALDKMKLVSPEYKEVPILVQITRLRSKSRIERRKAADKLAEMGPRAAQAVPALIRTMQDDSDWDERYNQVRRAAARALGEIGYAARAANPALIEVLDSYDYKVRLEAVKALGKIGPKQSPDVIEALTGVLKDPDFDVRREAVVALGNFEECAKCALPQLVTMNLSDQDFDVRREAVKSICRISSGSTSSVCALVQALDDDDVDVRREAVIALREAEPQARRQLLPEVIKRLNDVDENVRLSAIKTLATYGSSCEPVCKALDRLCHEDKSLEVRKEAAETLYDLKKIPFEEMTE